MDTKQNESEQPPSPGNTPTCPPEPKPLACGCGVEMRWEWCPPVKNPTNGEIFFWTNRWVRPGDRCQDCNAAHHAREAELVRKREIARREAVEKALEEEITKTLGGDRSLSWSFDKFNPSTDSQRRAMALAKSAASRSKNVYLWGKTTGTGKSHLAGAAYRQARMAGEMAARFWKPGPLLRWLRVLDSDVQEARIAECVNVGVFILDDIGIGNATDFALQAFYEIIDGRWLADQNGLIITANLSLDDLAQKVGDDRLSSRIAGMCEIVQVDGVDRRLCK